jgi:hypothetical protein
MLNFGKTLKENETYISNNHFKRHRLECNVTCYIFHKKISCNVTNLDAIGISFLHPTLSVLNTKSRSKSQKEIASIRKVNIL